jgi:hypothetical protein
MRSEHIAAIRAAVRKASPICDCGVKHCYKEDNKVIRLADVLAILGKVGMGWKAQMRWPTEGDKHTLHDPAARIVISWKFLADDIEQQSDETVAFISSLLTV